VGIWQIIYVENFVLLVGTKVKLANSLPLDITRENMKRETVSK